MIRLIVLQLLAFMGFVALQVLVFNHADLFYGLHPYMYLLILFWLPGMLPSWSLLVAGFVVGITMDLFMYTYGLHAGACTLAALVRVQGMPLLLSKEELAFNPSPRPAEIGIRKFGLLSLVLVLVHHFYLLYGEAFTLDYFLRTGAKALLNVFITILVVFAVEMIFYRSPKNTR